MSSSFLGPISSDVNEMVNTPATNTDATNTDVTNTDVNLSNVDEEALEEFVNKKIEDFYRRVYPGFEITSGLDTMGHGRAELCITTDTKQALHFYKQGNCKLGSRKSVEIRTGDKASEDDVSVLISAENGHIIIEAPSGNLNLRGENVLIESSAADGQVTIKSKKNAKIDAPTLLMESNMLTAAATSECLLTAGSDMAIYCESNPVEIGSGQDPIIGASITQTILNFIDKGKSLFSGG